MAKKQDPPQLLEQYMKIKTARINRDNAKKRNNTTRNIRAVMLMDRVDPLNPRGEYVIFGCVCVQDTPENPCPCTFDLRDPRLSKIYWVYDKPNKVEPTGETTLDGLQIYDFEFPVDAKLGIEVTIPITVKQAIEISSSDETPPSIVKALASTPNPASALWGAFTLGLAIGKWIDDSTGLSDWIAGVNQDDEED